MSFLADFFDEPEEEIETSEQAAERGPVKGAILAVDIGSIYTRAVLLDVVDGAYHFIARGEVPTTATAPWNNIHEGVRSAILEITNATGREILDPHDQLIMSEGGEFLGISLFVATASAGKPIQSVLVGLMPDVSLSSGKRAADSIYLHVADMLSMARSPEQQIRALIKAEPDLLLIVGGTDGGAVDSLRRQINTVAMTFELLEHQYRPTVLYAGNKDLRERVRERLGEQVGMEVLVADNVRPRLDVEYLDGAQASLSSLYHHHKSQNTGGFMEVGGWTDDGVFPTAHSFNRMVHILSQLNGHDVLGVDLGSTTTTISASYKGRQFLNVFGKLGVGHSAKDVLEQFHLESLLRWLSYIPQSNDDVLNYIWNKSLFPHTVPATEEELEIEYALCREVVRRAALAARRSWHGARQRGLLPPFGTIVLSGSTLTRPPHLGWSALNLLDAVLPVGIARLLSDAHAMAPALGTIAPRAPVAVVQVLETGAFTDLGTVISLSGRARRGETVLRGSFKPKDQDGQSRSFAVKFGTLARIPLDYGRAYDLTLEPRRVEIETPDRKPPKRLTVTGGELGLIIDARGRPYRLPRDAEKRHQIMREWRQSLIGDQEVSA